MKTYMKVLKILVLIIALLFFLQSSLGIYLTGKLSECYRIKITDYNMEKIVSLMENVEWYKEVPDISRVQEIEYNILWDDSAITVYYEDGTTYNYFNSGMPYGSGDAFLSEYIRNEGYKVYYRSLEFLIDLIKLIISIVFLGVTVVKVFDL